MILHDGELEKENSEKHRETSGEYVCRILWGGITRSHGGEAILSCAFRWRTKVLPADIDYLHLWGTAEVSSPVALPAYLNVQDKLRWVCGAETCISSPSNVHCVGSWLM